MAVERKQIGLFQPISYNKEVVLWASSLYEAVSFSQKQGVAKE